MQECTLQEFLAAIAKHRDVRRMHSKRSNTYVYSLCGVELGEKVEELKRGKLVRTTYYRATASALGI